MVMLLPQLCFSMVNMWLKIARGAENENQRRVIQDALTNQPMDSRTRIPSVARLHRPTERSTIKKEKIRDASESQRPQNDKTRRASVYRES